MVIHISAFFLHASGVTVHEYKARKADSRSEAFRLGTNWRIEADRGEMLLIGTSVY